MKERYLRCVHTLMDCPPSERERLLSRLNSAVTAYLEDTPEAGEDDLIANFGAPEDCAARLMEECAPKTVTAQRRKKTRRKRIIIAVLAALLVVMAGITVYLWSHGGLVIIERRDSWPDSSMQDGQITYQYD